jgi:S1-C subfamily serine protease
LNWFHYRVLVAPKKSQLGEAVRRKVEAATFRLCGVSEGKRAGAGQCVLIQGNYIVTAAHCVDHSEAGGMALGDYYLTTIVTPLGKFRVATAAVEPVSDIAVLKSTDGQELRRDADAFEQLCEKVKPLRVHQTVPKLGEGFSVWILTHEQTWIHASAEYFGGGKIFLTSNSLIKGGTSGGPVVNDHGELVGVVSNSSEIEEEFAGECAFVFLALPRWVSVG